MFPVYQAKASGAIYYVDNTLTDTHVASATPDCTTYDPTTFNCGTGSASAYATIADINASTFQPDDQVLFHRGQIWREQLTVPSSGTVGHPITFGAYGSDVQPVITGASLAAGSWTQTTSTVTGSVSKSNMRLSIVTGSAFVDFSSANVLTSYPGALLTITDSSGKHLSGYIKAAGTGETYASELSPNTDFANTTSVWTYQVSTASVVGGQSGNALQVTSTSDYGSAGETITTTAAGLYRVSGYQKMGTGGTDMTFQQSAPSTIYWDSGWPYVSSWTQYVGYGTANDTSAKLTFNGDTTGKTSLYDTVSVKQVLTPSVTGVTITSTAQGSTYAWTSEDSGFNRNDTSGYTYAINPLVSNVWQLSLATQPNQVFFNGTRGTPVSSVGAINTANQWYWSGGVLYVYATSNPSAAFVSPGVEVGARSYAIYINGKSNITVTNLDIMGSNTSGISFAGTSANFVAQNDTIEHNFHAGIESGVGGQVDNARMDSNSVHDNGASGIRWNGPYVGGTMSHNTIYNNGLFEPDATNGNDTAFAFTGGIDCFGQNASNMLIYANYVHNNGPIQTGSAVIGEGNGIWADTVGTGFVIRDNLVTNNYQSGILIEKTSGAQVYNNVLANNATYHYTADLILLAGDQSGMNTNNNLVYNNSMYGGWWSLALSQIAGNTMNNNAIKNNISIGTYPLYVSTFASNDGINSSGNVFDHNNFGAATSNFLIWGGPLYSTYGSWETAAGNCGIVGCSHSVQSDPLFTNAVGNDLTLQASSPAINAGLNLGTPYNLGLAPTSVWPSSVTTLDQNTNGSGWEIGAYVYPESTPVVVTPTPTPTNTGGGSVVGLIGTVGTFKGAGSGYIVPRPQIIYPDGRIVYLDASSTGSTSSTSSGQTSAPQVPSNSSGQAPSGSASYTFTTNHKLYDTGSDILKLQQYLNAHGFTIVTTGAGSPGHETTYFGTATFKALKKFQVAHGLPASGYFGPLTRAVIVGE